MSTSSEEHGASPLGRRHFLRWLAAGVGVSVAGGVLAACGGSNQSQPGAAPPTQASTAAGAPAATQPTTAAGAAGAGGAKTSLTFWNGFTGPDRPAVEGLVDQF